MEYLKKALQWLFRPLANLARKITCKLKRDVIRHVDKSIKSNVNRSINREPIPYENGEKVRVMFLFQAASLWLSWESFYEACMADSRINVQYCILDELYGDITQMLTAKEFLDEKELDYKVYSDKLFSRFNHHVLVMLTPYDYGHRRLHVRSATFRNKGTRIVLFPMRLNWLTLNMPEMHILQPRRAKSLVLVYFL